MGKNLEVLIVVSVLVLITGAIASAAGIQLLPSWSALFPARHVAFAAFHPSDAQPEPSAQHWCAKGKIIGGFCELKPATEGFCARN